MDCCRDDMLDVPTAIEINCLSPTLSKGEGARSVGLGILKLTSQCQNSRQPSRVSNSPFGG